MATVKHTGSKGMYSWWWNSHISPKNSKWLQENLRDMDTKVKQMIKLIEEDADSFARRAEMYYKKRPELMKLVEEFYRAYRALAERYDHATGVLRQAHRTMAEAFPNQVPMLFGDDSPGGSATEVDPRTPETPPPIQALLEPDELQKGALGVSSHATKRNGAFTEESESVTIRKGLKQFNDLFGSEEAANHVKFAEARTRKGLNFHDIGEKEQSPLKTGSPDLRAQVLSESERVSKAEMEILNLKNALAKLEAEKEAGLLQYQQSLERLSNLEREVSRAQEESQGLNKRANQAEAEVQTLKDALSKLEAEKEANLVRYHQCLEKINNLENIISHAEKDAGELNERANKAENEAQALKQDLARVKAEKEDALAQYKQRSETIINLEEKLLNAEESVRRLTERAEKAESELETLKRVVVELTKDKEVAALQYQQCLETISSLERKLACAQEEVQRLNGKINDGAANLKGAEERCSLLERTNQNLHTELESLLQKMGDQSQELAEKQKELGRLWTSIQEERMRFIEAETAFQTLQHLHSQSQEELRSLAMELQNRARILQVTETRIQSLEDELKRVKEENKGLSELNLSSVTSIKNLQDEILSLRKTIAKLEAEVELRVDQRNALQQEIYCLKEELNDFNKRHKDMTGQLESVGLNPETFASTVKELRDENTKLKYACERDRDEKLAFLEKLKIMEKLIEKNALLENSLSDLNVELESAQGRVKTLEESCHSLVTAKSALAAEKEALISQLQIATENLEKLSEKNNILENSLFGANAELGGLRVKIKSLENSCLLLGDEKSGLITQREGLLSELDVNQKRLEDLAKRYQGLEEKYASLEKERESTLHEIGELQKSLDAEKQEHASLVRLHETQVTAMESQIHFLRGESFCRKKEYEEELDNAMSARVEIFILQKCAQDLEEKNLSLLLECRKLLAASELSEKLISELELGNSKKQMEINSLFDQITLLRMGLSQMLRTLEIDAIRGHHDKIKQDQSVLDCIFGRLQKTQISLLKSLDENQQFTIENSVLIGLLRQLKLEAENLAAEKNSLHQELKVQSVQFSELENALFDANTELEGLREKVKSLENSCLLLGDEKSGLITQRELLISESDVSRKRLADLEKRYQGLEEKYVGLEMERESTLREVEELQKSLDAEKQEHASFMQLHESQVTAMESQIHFLQGESLCIKKEYEEELDKAMNAQVEIFILQKCAQDLEQNNICLLLEYRKLLEAFELSEKLISKLELGNSKKQMQIKSLFDQINRLRMGLDQMLRTLEIDAIHGYDDKIKQDQSVLDCIFGRLQRMQNSLLKSLDENQQFIIENSVLIGLLGQLKLEAENLATENNSLHRELKVQSEQFSELENSLFDANAKLEGLEAKLNSLEKSCLLLGHEKSGLLKQREGLISELNFSQKRLEDLEKRYQELEEKYVGLEKERDSTLCEAEELRKSLDAEKQEHATFVKLNETRVTSMESKIHFLQGESLCRKKEYEEQLDKAMNAQVEIFILQKCAQDLEENNLSLSLECRKLLEASKLSEQLISELELGSSKKQMEIKSLFDQITVLRMGLYQMSRTLEIDAVHGYDDMIKQDQSILDCIYCRLQKMQNSLLMSLDKNQQFIIENSVLIELLRQLKLEAENLATENNSLHQELNVQSEQFSELQNRAEKLADTNEELRSKVMQGGEREEVLRTEIGSVCVQLLDLQRSYQSSLEENCKLLHEKRTLMKEVLDLGKEKHNLEEENFTIFAEAISQSNISLIFKDIIADSIVEIKHLSENLDKLKCFNNDLEGKVRTMEIKFEDMLMENSHLNDLVQNLENELVSVRSVGDQLKDEVVNGRDLLCQKENELLQAEQLLSTTQEERAQLHKVVENLKTKYEEVKLIGEDQKTQILKLSGDYDHQSKETESFRQANQKFEAEILKLHEELQESKHREESLSVELRKGRNEVEIWETQATALFGELQNSAVREALLEEKAHELSMETESILQANQKFEAELLKLHEEIQERKHREENLSVELQKGRNEVELWETQAAALFGEQQSSAVREALLEEKAHELSMETESIRQANQKFEAVLLKLREDIQERKHREESLSVELQKGRNEVELWETQAAALFGELQSSAFREALLEDKAHELSLETENIRQANQKFEAELSKLHKELKERKHREESLSIELQKGRNEVELWETQAAAFFRELHSSSVREALLGEKAHELGTECEVLESRGKSKAMEVEELERSVRILECENEGLKAQLAAYVPAVRSLIDSVRSLESQTLLNPKHPKDYEEVKDANPGTELHAENCQQTIEDQIASTPDGFSDLQGIHMRIIAIEKAVLEMEKLSKTENLNLNSKLETAMRQIEELRYGSSSRQESITAERHVKAKQEEAELGQGLANNVKMQRPTPEISEEDNETMAKDIALDQISDCSSHGLSRRETAEVDDKMLELWETADCDGNIDLNDGKFQKMVTAPTDYQQIGTVKAHKGNHSSKESLVKELGVDKERSERFTEPDQEGSKRKILERLDSDAQKLANLQITVQDLKRKVETTEKSRKGKGIEYGTVKEQLGEAEEAIMKLFDVNRKLITQAEENSWSLLDKKSTVESDESGSVRKRSVSEQARKGSEKIGRLQVEVQKIQFLLLKLDDEKESRGRTRITERKTSVLLRDFIYGGIRNSQKRKKALFCACVQPPTKGD